MNPEKKFREISQVDLLVHPLFELAVMQRETPKDAEREFLKAVENDPTVLEAMKKMRVPKQGRWRFAFNRATNLYLERYEREQMHFLGEWKRQIAAAQHDPGRVVVMLGMQGKSAMRALFWSGREMRDADRRRFHNAYDEQGRLAGFGRRNLKGRFVFVKWNTQPLIAAYAQKELAPKEVSADMVWLAQAAMKSKVIAPLEKAGLKAGGKTRLVTYGVYSGKSMCPCTSFYNLAFSKALGIPHMSRRNRIIHSLSIPLYGPTKFEIARLHALGKKALPQAPKGKKPKPGKKWLSRGK